jgi:hypothetical protein
MVIKLPPTSYWFLNQLTINRAIEWAESLPTLSCQLIFNLAPPRSGRWTDPAPSDLETQQKVS